MDQNRHGDAPSSRSAVMRTAPQTTPRIDACELLGACREVILMLHGSEYRLRLTSKGKLILTK